MRLITLDIATWTGFAHGVAGEKPTVGTVRLRKPGDDLDVASTNLGHFLEDKFEELTAIGEKPDRLVYEAPIPPSAKMAMHKRVGGRVQNNASTELPFMNKGVLFYVCHKHGVEVSHCARATVLKHFTNQGTYGGGDEGRKAAKRAVVRCAQTYGYIPKTCADDDIADACAIYDWASWTIGKAAPRELYLFGEMA